MEESVEQAKRILLDSLRKKGEPITDEVMPLIVAGGFSLSIEIAVQILVIISLSLKERADPVESLVAIAAEAMRRIEEEGKLA